MGFDSVSGKTSGKHETGRRVLVDVSRRPIVVMTWPSVVDDAAFDEFRAYLARAVERGERYGLICDGRGCAGLNRQQLMRMAGIVREYAPRIARLCVAAIVIENDVQRATLKALNLFVPPPYPQRVFASAENAERWLRSELGV